MVTDLSAQFANALVNLRQRHNMSKAKIADKLYIDERTWAKYERGESAPPAPELVRIFDAFGEDVLKETMNCIYPETYNDLSYTDDVEAMRKAAVHFFEHVATDEMIRDFNFVLFGKHGSAVRPQLSVWVALDHLPMDYRVSVSKSVVNFYRLAAARHEIVCEDQAKPNFKIIVNAIQKGLESVGEGRNSYTY